MPWGKKIKLRFAISFLVIMSVVCTAAVSWFSATKALKDSLAENYLQSNYNYAKKLALSTSDLLAHMEEHISGIANFVGRQSIFTQDILDSYRVTNSNYFNMLLITDPKGVIQVMSPSVLQINGRPTLKANMELVSKAVQDALTLKRPLISEPYNGLSGERVLLISAPIFNNAGQYLGLVGGTVNLEGNNVIKNTLNKHQYENGSYVYVVDQKGRIIFHPDPNRLNENVMKNKAVEKVVNGESGSGVIINSLGNEFYAGYAHEKVSGWGIVAQTPTSVIRGPLLDVFKNMIIRDLPILLLILILAYLFSNNIARPLNKLAKHSENAIQENKLIPFEKLNIHSHILEVHYLYHHMNNYLNLLNRQIQIDGLTGLRNRKIFDAILMEWLARKKTFAMLLLDIDRFKKVNDTYGHLVGDEVLKYLARKISSIPNAGEYSFRYGGEEFVILLKNKNCEYAYKVAESLRKDIADTPSPTGEPITISIGITEYQEGDRHPEEIIERADTALYQSKANGRNQTTIYHQKVESLV